jgi:hypothetical protein
VRGAIWVGALAGLAASAKYSGLIALATAGVVLGCQMAGTAESASHAAPSR